MDVIQKDSRSGLATVRPPLRPTVTKRKCRKNIFKLTAIPRIAQHILLPMTLSILKQTKIVFRFCLNSQMCLCPQGSFHCNAVLLIPAANRSHKATSNGPSNLRIEAWHCRHTMIARTVLLGFQISL